MTRRGQWFLMFYLDFYSSAISPKIEQVLYFQNMTLEFRLVVTRPSCLTNQKWNIFKVHVFWEGHKIWRKLPFSFDVTN
jgi:hypothetical protein